MSTCMCMHRYACPFSHKDMCTLAKLSEVVVPSLHDLPVLLLCRRDCDHRLHHGADWFNCDPLEPDTGPGGFAEIAQHSSCEPELTWSIDLLSTHTYLNDNCLSSSIWLLDLRRPAVNCTFCYPCSPHCMAGPLTKIKDPGIPTDSQIPKACSILQGIPVF